MTDEQKTLKQKLKAFLINLGKKNHTFLLLIRFCLEFRRKIRFKIFSVNAKTDKKLVVFEAYMGRSYADSPRAIFEKMIKMKKFEDYHFVWVFKEPSLKIKQFKKMHRLCNEGRLKVVRYGQTDYYKTLTRAGYIIVNARLPECVKLRDGQKYVQCWHGTPLKRLGYDLKYTDNAMNSLKDLYRKEKKDVCRYSYMVSPSKFCTEKFTSAFGLKKNAPNCRVLEVGYPRNDVLAQFVQGRDFSKKLELIKKRIGLNKKKYRNKKVVLYAPTWREDQHDASVGYVYQNSVDFDYLQQKLSNEYVILFKAHYFIANSFDFEKYKNFIIDVSKYDDIAELFLISDILITDYSSVFFDYSILQRPIILYMYDYEHYVGDLRGFYFSPQKLAWPIVKTEKALVDEIRKAEPRSNKFSEKFIKLEKGRASKKVIEEVFE